MKKLIYLFLLSYNIIAFSQVGIGTTNPDSSSALDITSNDKGVLIPRVNLLSTTDTTTIASPANSLLVYNLNTIADVVTGFYYWNGIKWISISDGDTKWSLTGNAGTNASTNFIGTTDNTSLQIKVNNVQSGLITGLGGTNLFLGYTAGLLNTGILNAAFGHSALKSNTSGNNNIALGYRTLGSNTSGSANVAIGTDALTSNTTSSNNIGIGYNVLQSNVASDNIAIGLRAAFANTSGSPNLAIGSDALRTNTVGTGNIGIGYHALFNTTASDNIAIGSFALDSNTTGQQNIGIGLEAIGSNVSGSANTAMGFQALTQSTTADNNNAFGYGALGGNIDGNRNTAMGRDALLANVSGSSNTALGYNNNVGANNLNNTTTIGANAFATVDNALVLGSINGTNGATADALVGIGTTAPTAKLHINSASSNAFRLVDGNQAAGRVMTSDANGNATWATGGFTHYLGEAYLDGIIYYLYKGSDGLEHGLIVALTESTAKWQTTATLVNANRTEDGAYNTTLMSGSPANAYIATLGAGWYLPSIDELNLLYYNRYSVQKSLRASGNTLLANTVFTTSYWSSTEANNLNAYTLLFTNGYANWSSKTISYIVRAIRAF